MSYANADRIGDRVMDIQEARLLKAYQVGLLEVQADVEELYRRFAVGDKLTMAELTKFNRARNIEKQLVREIRKVNGKATRVTTGAITKGFEQDYYTTSFAAEQQVGAGLRFGLLNPDTIASAVNNPMDLIKWQRRLADQSAALVNQLRTTIVQGVIQGKGYPAMARLLKNRMEIGAGKAMRILRTEGHRAQVDGRLAALDKADAAAEELGLTMQRAWVANLDGRLRPSHGAVDGQIATARKGESTPMFTVSGVRTRGPGQVGIPAEDINCRCSVRSQIKGHPPQQRSQPQQPNIPKD